MDFRRETSEERQRDIDAILKIVRHAVKSKSAGSELPFAGSMTSQFCSNMAGIVSLLVAFLLLIFPCCVAKTPVIPPNHQLTNENWDRMLKGEWMVKL